VQVLGGRLGGCLGGLSREARRRLPCPSGKLTRLLRTTLSVALRAHGVLSMQWVPRLSLWLVLVVIRVGVNLRSMEVVSILLLPHTQRVLVSMSVNLRLLEFQVVLARLLILLRLIVKLRLGQRQLHGRVV